MSFLANAPDTITPQDAAADRTLAILDVRPRDERMSDLGFIPGSRWVPEDRIRTDPFAVVEELEGHRGVVLACLSGRRSAELVPIMRAVGVPRVRNLAGGLLAWGAELPLCRFPSESGPLLAPEEAKRRILACFVAESIENALDNALDDGFDPKAMVDAAVDRGFAEHLIPREAWQAVIDELAVTARRRGHPLDHIAGNVERLLVEIGA